MMKITRQPDKKFQKNSQARQGTVVETLEKSKTD
jgi:hypothetical protein